MSRRETAEREASYFAEPDFFEELLDAISDGATLADFTKAKRIRYRSLQEWIHGDQGRLSKYVTAMEARTNKVRDVVLRGLTDLASVDLKDLFDIDGTMKPLHMMPDGVTKLISNFEIETSMTESGQVSKTGKVKIPDRIRAFENLGRTVGMFKDNIKLDGNMTLASLVEASQAKTE